MNKRLVLAVDTQYDFIMSDGKLPVPGAESIIVPGIKYLAALKPEETIAILYTHDTHDEEVYKNSEEATQFPIHCESMTPGWENVFNGESSHADIPVLTLCKGVFDMWEENDSSIVSLATGIVYDRDQFFEALKMHGIDTVTVFGVAADFCVFWAIRGLVERGFKVEVVEHLTAGIERDMRTVVETEFEPGQVVLI